MSYQSDCPECGYTMHHGHCPNCASLQGKPSPDEQYDTVPDHLVVGMIADELHNIAERLRLIRTMHNSASEDIGRATGQITAAAALLYRSGTQIAESPQSQLYVHCSPR